MKRRIDSIRAIALLVGTVCLLTACTHTALPPPPTAIIENLAVTKLPPLPVSWTPAPTLTTAPTSSPFPTITPLPTLNADQICQNFHLIAAPAMSAFIAYDGVASFTWTGLPADTTLTLLVTVHGEKAGVRADIVTPGDGALAVPMLRLPQEGVYDWQLWVQSVTHPEYGQLCTRSGTIIRQMLVMM